MDIAFFLVALGVSVLAGTAIARRLDFPPPLFLVVAGFAASYLPGVPEVHLEPEVVLLGLLPPLLYAAAIGTSLVDFNANRRPILLLSVGLVVFTTVGVALLVHAMLPGVGWPAAFAIGAVVAPPDAVAATAIGRRIGLPRRIVTILEGESLLNDATALVALRTAIAAGAAGAAMTTSTSLEVGVGLRPRRRRRGAGRPRGVLPGRLAPQARHRPADGHRASRWPCRSRRTSRRRRSTAPA